MIRGDSLSGGAYFVHEIVLRCLMEGLIQQQSARYSVGTPEYVLRYFVFSISFEIPPTCTAPLGDHQEDQQPAAPEGQDPLSPARGRPNDDMDDGGVIQLPTLFSHLMKLGQDEVRLVLQEDQNVTRLLLKKLSYFLHISITLHNRTGRQCRKALEYLCREGFSYRDITRFSSALGCC